MAPARFPAGSPERPPIPSQPESSICPARRTIRGASRMSWIRGVRCRKIFDNPSEIQDNPGSEQKMFRRHNRRAEASPGGKHALFVASRQREAAGTAPRRETNSRRSQFWKIQLFSSAAFLRSTTRSRPISLSRANGVQLPGEPRNRSTVRKFCVTARSVKMALAASHAPNRRTESPRYRITKAIVSDAPGRGAGHRF